MVRPVRSRAALVWLVIIAVLLTACGGGTGPTTGGPTGAQTAAPREKLNVIAGTVEPGRIIEYVAILNGYYAAEGLDVEFKIVGANNVVNLIVSGAADLANIAVPNALAPVRDGKETVIIQGATGNGASGFFSGNVSKGITDYSQCKRITTFTAGSAAYAWAALYKKVLNLQGELVQLGDVAALQPSILSGQSDCGSTGGNVVTEGLRSGALRLLIDPRAGLPAAVPKNVLEQATFGLKDNLKAKRSAVIKYLKASQRAAQAIAGMSNAELAALLVKDPDWQAIGVTNAIAQLELNRFSVRPNNGYIESGIWSTELDWVRYGSPFVDNDAKWSFANRVDMSYYEEALGKPK
jgi:ABC-type nitrate/sulfonate/bicarbonate transport system substrate-binding protein